MQGARLMCDRPTIDARRALVVPTDRLGGGLTAVGRRVVCEAFLRGDVVVDGQTRGEHEAGVEALLLSDVIRDRQPVQDVEALHRTHEAYNKRVFADVSRDMVSSDQRFLSVTSSDDCELHTAFNQTLTDLREFRSYHIQIVTK